MKIFGFGDLLDGKFGPQAYSKLKLIQEDYLKFPSKDCDGLPGKKQLKQL